MENFELKNCINRDKESLKTFYKKFAPKIYCTCNRYFNDLDSAERAFKMCFIKIFTQLDQYDNDTELDIWINEILIETVLENIGKIKIETVVNKKISQPKNLTKENFLQSIRCLNRCQQVIYNLIEIDFVAINKISSALKLSEYQIRKIHSCASENLHHQLIFD